MSVVEANGVRSMSWFVPLAVAVGAWMVNQVAPLASALIVALVVGAVVANSRWSTSTAVRQSAVPAKFMLRLGVALLGLRLAASDFAQLGMFGVLLVLTTVGCTFLGTRWLGRALGLDPGLVSLIAAGFSICGAAAIAAVQDSIKSRQSDVALAVALVTVFGTVMIALIPALGNLFGFHAEVTGMWAGASIHEVAQVVAAAAVIGPSALAIAMGVKLGRVLMLAPVHHALSAEHHTGRGPLLREIPWFLYAFIAAVLVRSAGVLPEAVLTASVTASTVLLAAGMFGLGVGIALRDLWPVPKRALVLATASTAIATCVPLVMLLLFRSEGG